MNRTTTPDYGQKKRQFQKPENMALKSASSQSHIV